MIQIILEFAILLFYIILAFTAPGILFFVLWLCTKNLDKEERQIIKEKTDAIEEIGQLSEKEKT